MGRTRQGSVAVLSWSCPGEFLDGVLLDFTGQVAIDRGFWVYRVSHDEGTASSPVYDLSDEQPSCQNIAQLAV
jgi:hypothetical protein